MDDSLNRAQRNSTSAPLDPLSSLGAPRSNPSNKLSFFGFVRWLGQAFSARPLRGKHKGSSRPFATDVAMALDAISTQHEEEARLRFQRDESAKQNSRIVHGKWALIQKP